MFPLLKRKIGGYQFGQPTSYSNFHLGTDYEALYDPLRAPFSGLVTRKDGEQGGVTLYLEPDNSPMVMRFMHLSKVLKTGKILAGEPMATTGNTGTSTGPHLHLDISLKPFFLDRNRFIDPELYGWANRMNITVIGEPHAGFGVSLEAQVTKWSRGQISIDLEYIQRPIGNLGLDEMWALGSELAPKERFVLFYCNPHSNIYLTTISHDLNSTLMKGGFDVGSCAYEISHALNLYYNSHRGSNPYIEVEDTMNNPTDEQRYHKYSKLMPYLGLILDQETTPDMEENMTEKEVRQLQALEGYKDESGVQFWSGQSDGVKKKLGEYLEKRLKDKVKTINDTL